MGEFDSWGEWSRHVLAEIARLNDGQGHLNDKLDKHKEAFSKECKEIAIEISTLKVKATIWGAVGASVPLLLFVAIQIITKMAIPHP